jgi:hypothetical protein
VAHLSMVSSRCPNTHSIHPKSLPVPRTLNIVDTTTQAVNQPSLSVPGRGLTMRPFGPERGPVLDLYPLPCGLAAIRLRQLRVGAHWSNHRRFQRSRPPLTRFDGLRRCPTSAWPLC